MHPPCGDPTSYPERHAAPARGLRLAQAFLPTPYSHKCLLFSLMYMEAQNLLSRSHEDSYLRLPRRLRLYEPPLRPALRPPGFLLAACQAALPRSLVPSAAMNTCKRTYIHRRMP